MPDNGIKYFARGGLKLDDDLEDAIEAALDVGGDRPAGAGVGRVFDAPGAVDRYVRHLLSTISVPLSGLRIVVDCADGAASLAAPRALQQAGADVTAIHNRPDGLNINDGCGSTHLAELQKAVVAHGADAGFAFDGDADRCLAVDASGQVVDGDQLLAVLALAEHDAATLSRGTVVATVMSNLGFLQAMRAAGIRVVQAKVGDRYVLEEMRTGGYTLGGEQSGHVIMSSHATTGDGTLTALHVVAQMAATGRSLADLAGVMHRMPQVLINVPDVDKLRADREPAVLAAVRDAEAELGERGRVLLRPSGTESLVRVMVEAESEADARSMAERLADVVKSELAL
jgi:phosphoglucosamine mutase